MRVSTYTGTHKARHFSTLLSEEDFPRSHLPTTIHKGGHMKLTTLFLGIADRLLSCTNGQRRNMKTLSRILGKFSAVLLMSLCEVGCASVQTLTFDYGGRTYTSTDFQKVEGGYRVRSAETQASWTTAGVRYSARPSIYDVFVPESHAVSRSHLDWDYESPWLIIPSGIAFIIFLLWGLGKI